MKEIAGRVGFSSASRFDRDFKTVCGHVAVRVSRGPLASDTVQHESCRNAGDATARRAQLGARRFSINSRQAISRPRQDFARAARATSPE